MLTSSQKMVKNAIFAYKMKPFGYLPKDFLKEILIQFHHIFIDSQALYLLQSFCLRESSKNANQLIWDA